MPGTYLYGVVWAGDADAAGVGRRGVAGHPLRAVPAGSLAALVSDAPEDLAATREDLTTHAEILRDAAQRVTVLPMQFGVVMPGDTAVVDELLDPRRERLAALLEAVRGRVELELKAAYIEDAVLRDVLAHDPEARRLRDHIDAVPEDAGYYDRIRLGEIVVAGIQARRPEHADAILSRLEPLAVAVRVGEPVRELDVLNASFLVERDRVGEFDDAVGRLQKELEELVRFRYLGPLPAHGFVDLDGEVPAWA
jgi:hypothetical protein